MYTVDNDVNDRWVFPILSEENMNERQWGERRHFFSLSWVFYMHAVKSTDAYTLVRVA